MPPKPKEQVKGSGAEWYNIDFDPEILKKGAVVASAKVIKGQSHLLHLFPPNLLLGTRNGGWLCLDTYLASG